MSLYNILHGVNELAPILLAMLRLTPTEAGRFRDAYLNEDGTKIVVYTRNGGGNREHYDDECEAGENCNCTGCIITYQLPKHPNYIRDYDDDFDRTYAYVEFSVPEKYREIAKELATGEKPETIQEKFCKTMSEIENMTPEEIRADERFSPIVEVLNKVVGLKDKEEEKH